jgi:hypothetical protein
MLHISRFTFHASTSPAARSAARGDLIKGSGGLRKIRWRSASGGKRGGIRVIYYWYMADSEIFLLLAYGKTEKTDLSAKEIKILKALVEENM